MGLLRSVFRLFRTSHPPRRDAPRRHAPVPPRTHPVRRAPPARAATPSPATPSLIQGKAYVIDGDSLRIRGTEIRLFGVDSPELTHPYGKAAKWALVALCKGEMIRAEVDHIDRYGRTVARCHLPDGRDLSAEMVKRGLAIDWAKHSGGAYAPLETEDARRKLWLADARQQGRMDIWHAYAHRQKIARRP